MRKILMKYLILCLVLILSELVNGQQTNNWYFGSAAGFANTGLRIDFSSGSPVVSTGYPLMTQEGSSSISDASGNSLFYTDGTDVWDASTNTQFNLFALGGGSSSAQSAVIIPKPGTTDQWLLFTVDVNGNNGAHYVTVKQTGSSFSIVEGAPVALVGAGIIGEGLCIIGSTKASSSYWVLTRDRGTTGVVRAFEVTSAGVVSTTAVTSTLSGSGFTNTDYNSYIGSIKSNTCQNKIAITYYNNDADIVDFDASTGTVVSGTAKRITGLGHSYGLEFSPNDSYLYLTGLDEKKVYKYDIAANTVNLTFGTTPRGEAGQLQLGPDGKIYAAINNLNDPGYLGIISDPNLATSTFTADGLYLTGVIYGGNHGFSYRGLPTFPKSLVVSSLNVSPSGDYCTNTNIPLSYIFGGSVASQSWSISPGVNGTDWTYVSGTSTDPAPTVSFMTANTYTVTVTITDNCGRTYPQSTTLTIANPKNPSGSITCSASGITMNANAADPDKANYVWYNAASGGNVYGIGQTVTWNDPDNSSSPSTVWVEVAGSASSSSAVTNVVGPAPTWLNGSSYVYNTQFDVLADHVLLNSFQMYPDGWPSACPATTTVSFTIEIRNGSNTVVFSKPYSATITCGALITIPVGADLIKGNNYKISLLSFTSNASAWQQIFNGFPVTQAGVATVNGPTSNYTTMGNLSFTSNNFTITSTCSNRIAVNRACILPVEWTDFEASYSNGKVLLNWTTSSEINNQYFKIQKSLDGLNYVAIGTVEGRGTYKGFSNYSFTDVGNYSGVIYYRIAQVDLDDNQTYSPVKAVDIKERNFVEVFPSSSADNFNVQLANEELVTITLLDITGKILFVRSIQSNTTFGGELSPGSYFLKVQNNSGIQTIRLIKE